MIDLKIDFTASSPAEVTVVLTKKNPDLTGVQAQAAKAIRFAGKRGQTCDILGGDSGRIILMGLGDVKKARALDIEELGAQLWTLIGASGAKTARVDAGCLPTADLVVAFALGLRLRAYRFDKYLTREKPETRSSLNRVTIDSPHSRVADLYAVEESVVAGVHLARDLVAEVPNVLYPEAYANRIRAELEPLDVAVEILDESAMEQLGMGALLGVGRGSDKASRLAIMRWQGAGDGSPPAAFVGKGVTFDTGGISIKPAAGMWDMKFDMGGSAAVVGLMKALALRTCRHNVLGVVGLVENMPDGKAQRPGDIVTSMSGQTIQVLNTDAEGRLVLADALWYTQERFKPKFMVDLATLTGAMMVALGLEKAGVFSNDADLPAKLHRAGETTGDQVWHMPLGSGYNKLIDSKEADVKNIGGGRWGGAITAACFLERFVNKVPWAHIDMAGTVWAEADKPLAGIGATGFGVRLLDRFLRDNYEG